MRAVLSRSTIAWKQLVVSWLLGWFRGGHRVLMYFCFEFPFASVRGDNYFIAAHHLLRLWLVLARFLLLRKLFISVQLWASLALVTSLSFLASNWNWLLLLFAYKQAWGGDSVGPCCHWVHPWWHEVMRDTVWRDCRVLIHIYYLDIGHTTSVYGGLIIILILLASLVIGARWKKPLHMILPVPHEISAWWKRPGAGSGGARKWLRSWHGPIPKLGVPRTCLELEVLCREWLCRRRTVHFSKRAPSCAAHDKLRRNPTGSSLRV